MPTPLDSLPDSPAGSSQPQTGSPNNFPVSQPVSPAAASTAGAEASAPSPKEARKLRKQKTQDLLEEFGQVLIIAGGDQLHYKHFKPMLLQKLPSTSSPSELQLRVMFEMCDKDHRGSISFQEFANFVLEGIPDLPDVSSPETVRAKFEQYSKDGVMEGGQFSKLCQDSGFIGGKFKRGDADTVFAKASEGARKIDMEKFEFALVYVASKLGKSMSRVYEMVAREEEKAETQQEE
eukprot:TRINITY_DN5929_c0_g1_i2.p1 TRINITY_DN5929_c0_g1~~TRINITY_DN5929_c0_g1_i2.p1  ORF type:complete len:235 (-),score=52.91 TRINITY_DN5929_c0_g1_i2:61-765(-)